MKKESLVRESVKLQRNLRKKIEGFFKKHNLDYPVNQDSKLNFIEDILKNALKKC